MASPEDPTSDTASSSSSRSSRADPDPSRFIQFKTRIVAKRLRTFAEGQAINSTQDANNGGQEQAQHRPEHTRFSNLELFFNAKRAQLASSVSNWTKAKKQKDFLERIKEDTQGERVVPFPAGKHGVNYSEEYLADNRKKKKGSWEDRPVWLLRRHCLIEMWNRDVVTTEQLAGKSLSRHFMMKQLKEYSLYRVDKVTGEKVRSFRF